MAMSQILPTTFITQKPSLRPMYENVLPKSEMKETEESYLLHIQLPGFTKERIRITYIGSSGMLRIAGERPIVGGNKWSHLDQTYPIPENCEVDKLEANFEQGILTVTMPKKLISQVTPKQQMKTTLQKGPNPSKKDTPTPQGPNEIPSEPFFRDPTLKKQTGRSEKGQNEIEAQPTSSEKAEKESVRKNKIEEEYWMPYESRNVEKDIDYMTILKGKEIKTRKHSPNSSAPKASDKDTIGKGMRELVSYASKIVTRIGKLKLNDEEKPLVANIGAAIFVILALGAYVSYNFASFHTT